MIKPVIIAALSFGLLTACETAGQYPSGPGFYETQVEQNRFRITYVTPGGMPRPRAEDFLLLRAADVTLGQGYEWFRIVGRSADVDRRGGGPSLSLGTGATSFGGNTALGLGLGTSIPLGGGPRPVLNMEIIMGQGAAPADPSVYNAQDVAQTIRARL